MTVEKTLRVLAIDPGVKTGWALLETIVDGPRKGWKLVHGLGVLHDPHASEIAAGLQLGFPLDLVAVERPYAKSAPWIFRGLQAKCARWTVLAELYGVRSTTVNPGAWQWAMLKIASGTNRATRKAASMQRATEFGVPSTDLADDAADALMIAAYVTAEELRLTSWCNAVEAATGQALQASDSAHSNPMQRTNLRILAALAGASEVGLSVTGIRAIIGLPRARIQRSLEELYAARQVALLRESFTDQIHWFLENAPAVLKVRTAEAQAEQAIATANVASRCIGWNPPRVHTDWNLHVATPTGDATVPTLRILDARIIDVLRAHGPCSSTHLRSLLRQPSPRMQEALSRLTSAGLVTETASTIRGHACVLYRYMEPTQANQPAGPTTVNSQPSSPAHA